MGAPGLTPGKTERSRPQPRGEQYDSIRIRWQDRGATYQRGGIDVPRRTACPKPKQLRVLDFGTQCSKIERRRREQRRPILAAATEFDRCQLEGQEVVALQSKSRFCPATSHSRL